jgi:hypothetical protein
MENVNCDNAFSFMFFNFFIYYDNGVSGTIPNRVWMTKRSLLVMSGACIGEGGQLCYGWKWIVLVSGVLLHFV